VIQFTAVDKELIMNEKNNKKQKEECKPKKIVGQGKEHQKNR